MTGQHVKEKIENLEIPLAEVARRLSISPQTLQKRLNVDDMKIGMLEEIAAAINKSVYFFLEGSSINVQQQISDNQLRFKTQTSLSGDRNRLLTPTSILEQKLKERDDQLKEKDQVISDLRKTIQLYERLLNNKVV